MLFLLFTHRRLSERSIAVILCNTLKSLQLTSEPNNQQKNTLLYLSWRQVKGVGGQNVSFIEKWFHELFVVNRDKKIAPPTLNGRGYNCVQIQVVTSVSNPLETQSTSYPQEVVLLYFSFGHPIV